MPKKRYNAEEIIHMLREADVLLAQGKILSPAHRPGSNSRESVGLLRTAYLQAA